VQNVKHGLLALVLTAAIMPAWAGNTDVFQDVNGAKRHIASRFVCPAEIGRFDRDTVGERNPGEASDYCSYSARDGVYGTIILTPVHSGFDPKAMMAHDFVEQEGTGGRMTAEAVIPLGPHGEVAVYTRTYDAARIEAIRYRVLFSCAAVGNWAVEAIVEYADPRDLEAKDEFLKTVYAKAVTEVNAP
jgi:hypothetical protein